MSSAEPIAQFGYGAYNLSGNKKSGILFWGAVYSIVGNIFPQLAGPIFNSVSNGEDKLPQLSIDLGKQYISKKK